MSNILEEEFKKYKNQDIMETEIFKKEYVCSRDQKLSIYLAEIKVKEKFYKLRRSVYVENVISCMVISELF